MPSKERLTVRDCRCGAAPGALHVQGCSVEYCAMCGGQAISCDCVYEVNGIDMSTIEDTHPNVYHRGPTQHMYGQFDAEIEKLGGRLPWTGEFPGCDAAREFGLWCRMVPGEGWVPCDKEHLGATEDLNRLHQVSYWDRALRRRVRL